MESKPLVGRLFRPAWQRIARCRERIGREWVLVWDGFIESSRTFFHSPCAAASLPRTMNAQRPCQHPEIRRAAGLADFPPAPREVLSISFTPPFLRKESTSFTTR